MINVNQVEENVKRLVENHDEANFIYDLLLAYGRPKATVNRLKNGNLNLSSTPGEVSWKKQLFFKIEYDTDLHQTISSILKQTRDNQRFIIVTDFETFLAFDTKTNESLDINFKDFSLHYDFFLPWSGIEKQTYDDESAADINAAEKMAKLYDLIKKDNPDDSPESIHALNIFLSRLLFCFFAEDTNIFTKNQFTSSISSHTQPDGSDLNNYLENLFEILDIPEADRKNIPHYLNKFPYVNGELFSTKYQSPVFKTKSRQLIIDCGQLDWSSINPDIFGSMFQAVVSQEERGDLAMHYTSVSNIMRVIKPTFLNNLYDEFNNSIGNDKKLIKLSIRLSKIKIFDPACGSGNFLIIAFKELKRLEMKIFKEIKSFNLSQITPSQFYGIEINDFAHEMAKLSLWLTEHQMNIEFFDEFNQCNPTLPLQHAGNITCGNATRIDWNDVCPKDKNGEIYIIGNPPYSGSRKQNNFQKDDMKFVFKNKYKSLDYVSCWFYLAAKYINNHNVKFSFVTTTSISQGEQVALIWPRVLEDNMEIIFAYRPFNWTNNAKYNAGVVVTILGVSSVNNKSTKIIYSNFHAHTVKNISPYLVEGNNTVVRSKIGKPLSNFPVMNFGNMPADSGKLLFTLAEKNNLLNINDAFKPYFRRIFGADEFIKGKERWCLWFEHEDLEELSKNHHIKIILDEIRDIRLASSRPKMAEIPHLFAQITQDTRHDFILVPSASSENRKYVPIGFMNKSIIATNLCLIISNPEHYLFGVITSHMHNLWLKAVGGRLGSGVRYSKEVVYNTFPFPIINERRKKELTQHVFNILNEREKYPDKTMEQLYHPDKMPDGLRQAHHENDIAIELCCRHKPFANDEERLDYLFKQYENMITKVELK